MFDAQGVYSPPDVAVPHVVVTTEAHTIRGPAGQLQYPVAAGVVLWAGNLGHSQIAHIGPPIPKVGGRSVGALIEHATAKVGDILPLDEITPAIAVAEARQQAVKVSVEARRAAGIAARQAATPKPTA